MAIMLLTIILVSISISIIIFIIVGLVLTSMWTQEHRPQRCRSCLPGEMSRMQRQAAQTCQIGRTMKLLLHLHLPVRQVAPASCASTCT